MDFSWTADQEQAHEAAARFARAELGSHDPGADRERWRACARFGLTSLTLPPEHGGLGGDAVSAARIFEGMGYGADRTGLLFGLGAQLWAVATPLRVHGSDEQKRRILPGLCSGDLIGAFASTEPGAGSDAGGISCRAVADGDSLVVTGRKAFVTNAVQADVFLVTVMIDPAKGWRGQAGLLIERDTPGLTVEAPIRTMGLREASLADVVLDEVRVPLGQLLPDGHAVFRTAMEWERALVLAPQLGAMRRQVERAVQHARSREQFGRPIARFQAVSHRIADMSARLETARLLLYRAAWALDRGAEAPFFGALAKLATSEAAVASHLDGLLIHGASGYTEELPMEGDLRDAVGTLIHSGTSDVLRNVLAGLLGL